MKSSIYLIVLLLVSSITIAQNSEFELSSDGFTEYSVTNVDGKSKEEIFDSLKKWFEYNIRNAKKSNNSEIENEYLAYRIILPKGLIYRGIMTLIYDIELDVELRIKDGKFRTDLTILSLNNVNPEYASMELQGDGIIGYSLYKMNGAPRKNKAALNAVEQLNFRANKLNRNFKEAILSNSDSKKDDW